MQRVKVHQVCDDLSLSAHETCFWRRERDREIKTARRKRGKLRTNSIFSNIAQPQCYCYFCCCTWQPPFVQPSTASLPITMLFATHLNPVEYSLETKLGKPCQLCTAFLISHVLFYPLPFVLPLSSSSHFACAIQWCHILPVTRRPRLPCHRAPPPSLLSLWQLRAAQSPHKMPTRMAGTYGAAFGPQTVSAVPSTAQWTAWTAPRQSPWPWSQRQARGTRRWVVTPPSRHVTKQCWCRRLRNT